MCTDRIFVSIEVLKSQSKSHMARDSSHTNIFLDSSGVSYMIVIEKIPRKSFNVRESSNTFLNNSHHREEGNKMFSELKIDHLKIFKQYLEQNKLLNTFARAYLKTF